MGLHDETMTQHGLRRVVPWGMAKATIQVYLTPEVMILKYMAA